jgi:diaminohydroxyphosphoribosylaminopyrimidine deaminase/5-amino-6-(5-phosphoribosylamino)uracil reductase
VGPDARILKGEPPIIFTVSEDAAKRQRLEALGVEVLKAPIDPAKEGKTDLVAIARELGKHGFNEVTIETGAKLNGSLIAAGVIDEIVLYMAPKILGDTALGLFAIPELKRLADAQQLRITDVRNVGPELRVTARIVR